MQQPLLVHFELGGFADGAIVLVDQNDQIFGGTCGRERQRAICCWGGNNLAPGNPIQQPGVGGA